MPTTKQRVKKKAKRDIPLLHHLSAARLKQGYVLYADGGTIGKTNPGDDIYFSVGIHNDGKLAEMIRLQGQWAKDQGFPMTNNTAEFCALLLALAWVKKAGVPAVIVMDSQMVVRGVAGRWPYKKTDHLAALQKMVLDQMDSLAYTPSVVWSPRERLVKILGH